MTDREKAIVTAYTGINMLEGERFNEFYKYLEELYGRPVYTHEILFLDVKEKSEDDFLKLCREKTTISPQKWILCSERMPEEHDSIFSKFYGTEKWRDAMFRKTSKTVIITVEHRDGTRQTAPCHTIDGEWNQSMKGMGKVIAWTPLPEPMGCDSDG